jgi:hypothetical protein
MWHFVEQEACSLTATCQETKDVKMILVRSQSFKSWLKIDRAATSAGTQEQQLARKAWGWMVKSMEISPSQVRDRRVADTS